MAIGNIWSAMLVTGEKKPILVSTVTRAKRLANREEIKFMKDNKEYGWKPL